MKTFVAFLILLATASTAGFAQPSSPETALTTRQTENMLLLARVWGFVKYFHPAMAAGKTNWDDALLTFLPIYRNLTDRQQINDSLLAWIDRLGPVENAPGNENAPTHETAPPKDARLSPDLTWMDDPFLSPALSSRLHQILAHRKIQPNPYVECQPVDGVTLPLFRHERSYPIHYPDTLYGTLCLFRLWNVIAYWYPYKYNLPVSWDDVFRRFLPRMTREQDVRQYASDAEALLTAIEDTHGMIFWSNDKEINGSYVLPFTLHYAGKWVVTSILNDSLARTAGIRPGDIVDSLDGRSVSTIVDSLAKITPASNPGSLMIKIAFYINRTFNAATKLRITRGDQSFPTVTVNYQPPNPAIVNTDPAWFPYAQDSALAILPGNIVYLNMGLFDRKDSSTLKALLAKSAGLVIDDRQNADEEHGTNAADIVTELIVPPNKPVNAFSSVESSFPGVYRLFMDTLPFQSSDHPYAGKIAILINENSTSVGEFISMIFRTAPHSQLIGTRTAGADGNVTYLPLPGGGLAQFTGLGVYYPDGRETQRVGLQPDIVSKPTLDDFLRKRDVQLEKALLYLTRN